MQQDVLSVGMGSGSLASQQKAKVNYLRTISNPSAAVAKVLKNQVSSSNYHRYSNKFCPTQSNAKTRSGNRHVSTVNAVNNGHVQLAGSKGGQYSSNFQVRNGQKLLEPFDGLPLCFIHPMTINTAYLYCDADLRVVASEVKERLHQCHKQLSPGAIIRGYFDIAMTYADGHKYVIPKNESTSSFNYPRRDHEIVAMFHSHFIVYEPQMSAEEVREVFAKEFPGSNRICLRTPHTEKVSANGKITRGIQGYAEYASMEKVELKFGKDNGKALLKYIELDDTWDRRSKLIRFGNRSERTITSQNLDIYNSYLHDLTEKKKDNQWLDIEPANRFMHVWFNHTDAIRSIYTSIGKNSRVCRNDRLIRELFLCIQSNKELKNVSDNIHDIFGCLLHRSCPFVNVKRHVQTKLKLTFSVFCYSNSTSHSWLGILGNKGVWTWVFQHTGERRRHLMPP